MAKKKDNDNYQDDDINDDTFGLPDIEYKPLEPQEDDSLRESATTTLPPPIEFPKEESRHAETQSKIMKEHKHTYAPLPEDEDKSKLNWLWIVLLLLCIGTGLFLAYKYLYNRGPSNVADKISVATAAAKAKRVLDSLSAIERQRQAEAEMAAKDKDNQVAGNGNIETISSRNGRYFIVISSSIDGDLAMDYAKKLSKQGMNLMLIPSKKRVGFTRLAIANFATLSEAQNALDAARNKFGVGWVLKY